MLKGTQPLRTRVWEHKWLGRSLYEWGFASRASREQSPLVYIYIYIRILFYIYIKLIDLIRRCPKLLRFGMTWHDQNAVTLLDWVKNLQLWCNLSWNFKQIMSYWRNTMEQVSGRQFPVIIIIILIILIICICIFCRSIDSDRHFMYQCWMHIIDYFLFRKYCFWVKLSRWRFW